MISAKGFVTFLDSVHRAGGVYVWGGNLEFGTKELLEFKKKTYGKEHYTDLTIEMIEGRLCADCSGLFAPISGYDDTAHGYYEKCVEKGRIGQIPRNKKCLLFREQNGRMVHMAGYEGNGYLVEMWDGCEKREFKESQWTHFGFPAWLEAQVDELIVGGEIVLTDSIKVYNTAMDAKNDENELPFTYPSGKYYIYKIDDKTGAVNITRDEKEDKEPGAWVILP